MQDLLGRLCGLQLVVVTGKGGVGKSTFSATLGQLLARAGRRVLLLDIDPRESLYPLLGIAPSDGVYVEARPGLHLQSLRPRAVLDGVVEEQLRIDFLVRRIRRSPIYEHFVEGAPGLKELAVLGHAWRIVHGKEGRGAPEVDLVILDAPATGHGLSMMTAPQLVSEVIRDGPFGQMAGELARLVADASRCGVVVVAFAEEMPVQEAIELIEALDTRLERRPELVAVNRLYPPTGESGDGTGGDALAELWHERRAVNDRELRRLEAAWDGARLELPLLPIARGPELVGALEPRLHRLLTETPWS